MGKPIKEGGKKDKESRKKASDASTLPEHLELQRTHVVCGTERNKHVSPTCHCCQLHNPCSGRQLATCTGGQRLLYGTCPPL